MLESTSYTGSKSEESFELSVLSREILLTDYLLWNYLTPFTPILYFSMYNAEENLLWEVSQNFHGVSEGEKKTSEISVDGLRFDSSNCWIWEPESQERISLNWEAEKSLIDGVMGNPQRRTCCAVDYGMIRASGKFGPDNANNLQGFFIDMN